MEVILNTAMVGKITITNERAESSYGIPVAVFNGVAYGPNDNIVFPPSELDWLKEPARTTVAGACIENKISGAELDFVRSFNESRFTS